MFKYFCQISLFAIIRQIGQRAINNIMVVDLGRRIMADLEKEGQPER
jgi:hypothetical protein